MSRWWQPLCCTTRRRRTRSSSQLREGRSCAPATSSARRSPSAVRTRPGTSAHSRGSRRTASTRDDVKIEYIPFPQVVGALAGGQLDAAVVAEPYLTLALEQGAKQFAKHLDAVCSKTCQIGFWLTRDGVDQNLVARFRNAVQNAAVWANQDKNDQISGQDSREVRADRLEDHREDEAGDVRDSSPRVPRTSRGGRSW